jgi:EAL domain-containing protein (putative c-di-GMP-specific phosphodiesterase class I)
MNAADVAIVRAITAMARSLRLRTVAEGVESPDQKLFLAAEGCDEAQGFLFGRPMDAALLGSQLAAQSGAGSSVSNS